MDFLCIFKYVSNRYSIAQPRALVLFSVLVVVNMILINMMMAIINMAFEEIKENADQYQNKFELLDYLKRTCREIVGITVARPIRPK